MSALIGDGTIHPEAVEKMVAFCNDYADTRWAAYQNVAMDSAGLGELRFIAIGPNCTVQEAPERHPDTAQVIGWRYYFVGWVDLEKGLVVEGERK
jgi:hypothetical protein